MPAPRICIRPMPPADTGAANAKGDTSSLAAGNGAVQTTQVAQTSTTMALATPVATQLANQVIKAVGAKSTRFELTLDPAGLGRVDVRVDIDSQGQLTAQFSFANPHAAAEARGQAGQLQQALEQAGFSVGQSGLSFDVGGQGFAQQQNAQNQQQPQEFAPSATPVLGDASIPVPSILVAAPARASSGLDITI